MAYFVREKLPIIGNFSYLCKKESVMRIEMEEDIRDLIEKGQSRRYIEVIRNKVLFNGLMRAYQLLEAASSMEEAKMFSVLHYEKLRYGYSGLSSVRLDNRYIHRLIFEEKKDRITLKLIEIDNTHYGNKK